MYITYITSNGEIITTGITRVQPMANNKLLVQHDHSSIEDIRLDCEDVIEICKYDPRPQEQGL